jgi:hypothetical protein
LEALEDAGSGLDSEKGSIVRSNEQALNQLPLKHDALPFFPPPNLLSPVPRQ